MWKWLSFPATVLAIVAALVGILVDFPIAKQRLEEPLSNLLPFGTALLYFVVFGLSVYCGILLLWWVGKACVNIGVDIYTNRPSRLLFQQTLPLIDRCRELLDSDPMVRYFPTKMEDHEITLSEELAMLAKALQDLDIWSPSEDLPLDKDLWSRYLTRLRVMANYGNVERARQLGPENL